MMTASNAAQRAARYLQQMDDRAESGRMRLDHYARMARTIADVPIGVVTFATLTGVQIRGQAGVPDRPDEIPSHIAFCTHALQERGTVYIPDLAADVRFTDHPEVRAGARLRFYAAAPLLVDEQPAIGCLCLLDYRPRELTTAQLRAVRLLGDDLQRELGRSIA